MSIATKNRPPGEDPTVYPVDDGMGEGTVQHELAELLRPLVARHLAAAGVRARVGANQFVYWAQHEPTRRVSPDVYVLPGVDPLVDFGAWKVWETGVVPTFALEIVSRDVVETYEHAPRWYADLGVGELIVFDPLEPLMDERCRWLVYRSGGKRGFSLVEHSNADRVRSDVLGCWLRDVPASAAGGTASKRQLRLAVGPRGDELVLTEAEAERRRREGAEADLAQVRAELERLRRG